jgi:hypothetical protein
MQPIVLMELIISIYIHGHKNGYLVKLPLVSVRCEE